MRLLASGAFREAYAELVPQFEQATGHQVTTEFGASQGGATDSIPSRLQRGEAADVVVIASGPMNELIKSGYIRPETRIDMVRSGLGMVVRKGASRPDISSESALKRTLL